MEAVNFPFTEGHCQIPVLLFLPIPDTHYNSCVIPVFMDVSRLRVVKSVVYRMNRN